MSRTRLALALLLTLAVATTTWLRSDPGPGGSGPTATIVPIVVPRAQFGPLTIERAWEIRSGRRHFGGFSALVVLRDGRFLAGSDTGRKLLFERPDQGATEAVMSLLERKEPACKGLADLESLTIDPQTGTVWGGFERSNAIVRFGPDLRPAARRGPREMRDWKANGGPEAFARLDDGRFLAIEEESLDWAGLRHRAVLFDRDPVVRAPARELIFEGAKGYSPVDLVPLERGRALVLLRDLRLRLPPYFATAIGFIDVDMALETGRIVTRNVAETGQGFPRENYEGAALTYDGDGGHLWLISDDNQMHYQRTLLLKLAWPERQKARE
ncbi:MAG: esterase-like activity of phytase family protein [Erythrobacter sp.]|jgi:hypothetical protein